MTAETFTSADPIERAEGALKLAVASGDARRIGLAQQELDRTKQGAALATEHAAREQAVRRELEAEQRKKDKGARRAKADQIEAELRAAGPEVVFAGPGGRRVIVRLGGTSIDLGYAVECCRRLAYAIAHRAANQIVASRAAGQIVHQPDWLSPMLDSDGGLRLYLQRGVCRVEEASTP